MGGGDVTNVTIACTTNNYSISGTVTGLAGAGLKLRNNNNPADEITIAKTGPFGFTFSTPILSGATYAVTVVAQPTNLSQTCTVTNGGGTVGGASVTNVAVNCVTNSFTVGGTVTGHNGTGLTLRLNGTTDLAVSGNGSFTFPAIADGSAYSVVVFSQPVQQTCPVTSGSGTLAGGSVANIVVSCATNTYTVGGTISGLTGTGLVLRNSYDSGINAENLTVLAGATTFTFANQVAYGSDYSVSVLTDPSNPTQTCTVTANGAGPITGPVTNITISCTTNSYTIGGTISGLTGTGLVLHNGSENLTVLANATGFTFVTPVASGQTYTVTVQTQPSTPTQTCAFTPPASATGTVTNANITSVNIVCTTNTYFIGVTVSGLSTAGTTTGVVLQNNGGDNKTFTTNSTSNFTTKIASGGGYNVSVLAQPTVPSQTCTVTGGLGVVGGADVSVAVACVTPSPRFAYVANFGDNSVSVYTVNATTGQLRFKGYVAAGSNPIAVAVDPAGKFAYVTNNGSGDVSAYTIDSGTGALTPIDADSGTSGIQNFPARPGAYSVTVDPSGKFAYVVNADDNSVSAYTIDSGTGVLTHVDCSVGCVGTNFAAGASPRSVAIDPTGTFAYVANNGQGIPANYTVSAYTINSITGALTPVNGSPFLTGGTAPRSVTIDPSGKFAYVANDGSNDVSAFTITPSGPNAGALVAAGSPVSSGGVHPLYVTVDPTGRFAYVANQSDDTVTAFTINTTTGVLTSAGTVAQTSGSSPVSVTVDSTGKFAYVSNSNFNNISAYTINPATGALTAFSTFIGRATNEVMAMTKGAPVVYTPKFAYVANAGSANVQAYTINSGTGALTSVGTLAAGTTPLSVAVDPSGQFAYVANNGSANVSAYTINPSTGALTSVGSAVAAGTNPISVTVDSSGKFAYVANNGSANVSAYTINPSTGALTSAGTVAAGTGPTSVSLDPAGRFAYVANADGTVSAYTINASTGALTGVGAVAAGTGPMSVSVDPTGRFAYVANLTSGDVSAYSINSVTGALTPINCGGGAGCVGANFAAGTSPVSITVGASGKVAYVVNSGDANVSRYTINATTGALVGVDTTAAGNNPASVTVDASGKFAYVANKNDANVSGYSIDASTGALTGIGTASAGSNPSSVATTGTIQ